MLRRKKLRRLELQLEVLRMAVHSNQTVIKQLGKDLMNTVTLLNKTLIVVSYLQMQLEKMRKKEKVNNNARQKRRKPEISI